MQRLPSQTLKSTLTLAEAGTVAAICFGLFTLFAVQAALAGFPEARFSDAGHASIVGMELVLASCALIYLNLRRFDIASLYPAPTVKGSVIGVALAIGICLVCVVVVALFETPGQIDRVAVSFADVSPLAAVTLALVNGTYEEVFLLGVLTRGLRGFGLSVAVGLPLLVRLLYHVYQGPLGLVTVGVAGLGVTLTYLATGRLWPSVFAHILLDLVPMM